MQIAIEQRRAKQGVDQLRDSMGRFTRSTRSMDTTLRRGERTLRGFGRSAQDSGRALRRLFGIITAGLAVRRTVRVIAQFEERMKELGAVTQTVGTQTFAQFEARARQLGATTRFTAAQAAEGMVFLARAGFDADATISAIGPSLNLAAAGLLSLGEAADIASNVMAQFNLTTTEVEHITDVLVNTANRANTDVRQLAEGMKLAGPFAGALGKSLNETSAALGVLGDAGVQGSLAGTNLRGVLAGLIETTEKTDKALSSLGLTIFDVTPITHSLTEIFETFRDAGLGAEEALAIFGRRNVAGALILTQSIDKMKQLTEENKVLNGLAREQAEIMNNTLVGAWKELNSAIDEAILKGGDSGLAAVLRDAVDWMARVVRWLQRHGDSIRRFQIRLGTDVLNWWEQLKGASQIAMEFITNVFTSGIREILNALDSIFRGVQVAAQSLMNNPTLRRVITAFSPSLKSVLSDPSLFSISEGAGAIREELLGLRPGPSNFESERRRIIGEVEKEISINEAGRVKREVELEGAIRKRAEAEKELEEKLKNSLGTNRKIISSIDGVTDVVEEQSPAIRGLNDYWNDYVEAATDAGRQTQFALATGLRAWEDFAVAVGTKTRSVAQAAEDMVTAIQGSLIRMSAQLIAAGVGGIVENILPQGSVKLTQNPATTSGNVQRFFRTDTPPQSAVIQQQHGGTHTFRGPLTGYDARFKLHGTETVQVTPQNQASGNLVVQVFNQSNVKVTTRQRRQGNTRTLQMLIADAAAADIRGGGSIARAMRETFGSRPLTRGR